MPMRTHEPRAGIAQTLQTSEYTSVARRLRGSGSAETETNLPEPTSTSATPDRNTNRLRPIAGLLQHQLHTITTEQYVELVAWSSTIARSGKHHLAGPTAALKAMGCDEAEWKEQINAVRCGWRVVGGSVQMRELAQKIGGHWFKRRSRRPETDTPRLESG